MLTFQQTRREARLTEQPQPRMPSPQKLPNSAMLLMMGTERSLADAQGSGSGLGNRMESKLQGLHLLPQIPRAEAEADALSSDVRASSAQAVKAEMGRKLGADLTQIRLHTDAGSAAKANSMGARAFTSGRDIFFGSGGFDPQIAAHELVHTAQQGVAQSSAVSESAPTGGVQMWPWSKKKPAAPQEKAPEKEPAPKDAQAQPFGFIGRLANKLFSWADKRSGAVVEEKKPDDKNIGAALEALFSEEEGARTPIAPEPEKKQGFFGRLGGKIKSGFNAGLDAVAKKLSSMKRKNERAVDDFNTYRSDYEGMSRWDRFKWSIQNPIARLTASKRVNGTLERANRAEEIENQAKQYRGNLRGWDRDEAYALSGESDPALQPVDKGQGDDDPGIEAQAQSLKADKDPHNDLSLEQMEASGEDAGIIAKLKDMQKAKQPAGASKAGEDTTEKLPVSSPPKKDEGASAPIPEKIKEPEPEPEADEGISPETVKGGLDKGSTVAGLFSGNLKDHYKYLHTGGSEGTQLTRMNQGAGFMKNTLAGASAMVDMASSADAAGKRREMGDTLGAWTSGLRSVASAGDAGGSFGTAQQYLSPAAMEAMRTIAPAISAGTNGIRSIADTADAIGAGKRKRNMGKRAEAYEQRLARGEHLNRHDEMTRRILNQARGAANADAIQYGTSAGGNAAKSLGAALTASGIGAPVGVALSTAGSIVSTVGSTVANSKRKDVRTQVAEEEKHVNLRVQRFMHNNQGYTEREAKNIVVKGLGNASGRRSEIAGRATIQRADELINRAKAGDPEAVAILQGMQVSPVDGEYSRDLIAERLAMPGQGQSAEEKLQSIAHSRDRNNPFKKKKQA